MKYTESHEWIKVENGIGTIGISDHAQNELSDVVFVDLPETGKSVEAKSPIAVVESVKAASDIYAPVSGEILEVNNALSDDPALINTSPQNEGWIFKLKLSQPDELDSLMDEAAYLAQL